jgi:hypothetical protein
MGFGALGLAYLGTTTVHSGYAHVLASLMLLGIGIGFAIAPATESIMGSLPVEKAGIGSAMNDTTRQVGGALGVAILGSVFSSAYVSHLGSAFKGVPPAAAKAAGQSVGAALAIAHQVGGAAGQALDTVARTSFVHAMDRALLVGAGFALLGAIVALIWLPNRPAASPELEEAEEADRVSAY